ncbi:MAG: DUF4440 domain-containing protein [Roseibium sp.]|uniref:YybH family protein n=1 Tax=Roseibium sp. TaxID=1936156 RepID=UPI0026087F70|nr:DUF4440 domain-containing protein [Roseibium sp.]MCV0424116.1 DUF4440 domain-containing protein [Roseibium sp.]
MTQDQQDVLALVQKMTSSFEAGDLETVMQTYEPNQTIMFQPGEPVSDRDAARAAFEQISAVSPKFSYSGHEVIVEGDIAVHIAPWQMTGSDPEGNKIEGQGLSIAVLRRQSDGAWKMVIDNPHGGDLMTNASN